MHISWNSCFFSLTYSSSIFQFHCTIREEFYVITTWEFEEAVVLVCYVLSVITSSAETETKGAGGCVLRLKITFHWDSILLKHTPALATFISMGWWIWWAWANTLVLGPGSSHHWVKWFWRLGQDFSFFCTLLLFVYFWNKQTNKHAKNQEPVKPREMNHSIPTVEASNSTQTGIENWGNGVCQDHPKSDWTYFFIMKHGNACPG